MPPLTRSAPLRGYTAQMGTRRRRRGESLALAREDQAAAVAGIDAEQLAAMGPDSMLTDPAPCCDYPEIEAGQ